jgi:quinol-cytochrome oxidoreductase complex cytochrome b subunit
MDYIDKARSWLDARLPVSEAREFAAKKTVPVHRYTVLYYLGGMTLFFLRCHLVG